MSIYTFYILMGIGAGVAALYGMWHQITKRIGESTRHTLALERNTEATDRLNGNMEKITDKLLTHEKRLDKLDYRVFGFDNV